MKKQYPSLKRILSLIFLVLPMGSLTSLQAAEPNAANETETDWVGVKPEDFSSAMRVTGRVAPQDGALHIQSARVQGRITGILKREGEIVQVGTPLFEISSGDCFAVNEEKKVAQKRGLKELLAGVSERERQLGISVQGDKCRILADQEGTLTKRNVESGSAFNLGDPLVNILDVAKLTIELDLPERDLSKVKPGQKVKLQLASQQVTPVTTSIQYLVPTIDVLSRTVKARLKPVKLPKGTNLDALVFGDIDTGTNERVLSVPTFSLVFYQNRQFLVKRASPKPIAVQVQVLSETDSMSSVRPAKEGELKEGDFVAGKGSIFLFRKILPETVP